MKKSLLLLLLLSYCTKTNHEKILPKASKGVLDLRNWDFEKNGNLYLDGDWEFHWKKFLSSKDFHDAEKIDSTEQDNIDFISVPSSWENHNVAPKGNPAQIIDGNGYATYRLKFLTNQTRGLSLHLQSMGTAYKLFINGTLMTQVGQIGTTIDTSKPEYKVHTVRVPEWKSGEYEIIIQISNFNYKQGGIWYPISIGRDSDINSTREKNLFIDLFLTGSLLIMGLYHFGLFSVKRKDSSALWFGVICLLIAVRTLLTGECYLYTLFPHFSFNLGIKMEYGAFYLAVPFFLLYLREIFPVHTPKIPLYLIQGCSYLLLIPVLIFPPQIFTHAIQLMHIVTLLAVALGLYIFVRSIISRHEGAKSFLLGSLVMVLSIVNDVLHTSLIIHTGHFFPIGLFIFIFSQAYLLSVRFAKAFTQVEELSVSLESKVIERTKQLEQAKQLVEAEHEKSEKLLLNILPEEVALELKERGQVRPVYFDNASILFTDFEGFTQIAKKLSPQDLVQELDSCFTQFDKIIEDNSLEKLKTIGDSYMCAGGIPRASATHAIDSCLAALQIQIFMNQMRIEKQKMNIPYWQLRLGIHSGPIMAGVVGQKKFAYDIWGDTVNIASRMESSGATGKINISDSTYHLVKDYFDCEYRGEIEAKNSGKVKMYFLNRIKPEFAEDTLGLIPNSKLLSKIGR